MFKKKYFIADEELTRSDEIDVRLLYAQCVDGLVSGFFRCDQGHVIGLAALEARVYKVVEASHSVLHFVVHPLFKRHSTMSACPGFGAPC